MVSSRRAGTGYTKLAECTMMERTQIDKQTLTIDGICYTAEDARPCGHEPSRLQTAFYEQYGKDSFQASLADFLAEWFSASEQVLVHTSGSTGTPKPMWVEKQRMMASACLTCSFLGLQENDTALLCMPLKYIAGKMVVVRALVYGLNLIISPPSGHPLANLSAAPVFAAMIPMQVFNSLQNPCERTLLTGIKHLIIGGGAVDAEVEKQLQAFPHAVWSTYGMTETLSHIALRRLNGPSASEWYTPFDNVTIRLSEEQTLVIHAPHVHAGELVTNDIVEMNEAGQFRILGRKDNTINSGGVKIQIEQVEKLLHPSLPVPFLITSAPDAKFGERVVLLVEGTTTAFPDAQLETIMQQVLPPYWRPKQIIHVTELPRTGTGKPDRATARKIAAGILP